MSKSEDIITAPINIKKIKEPVQKVGKDHIKYIVLLKLLNAIFVNIGRNPIDDITQFVSISRDDIIKDVNKISLENMESELFPLYDKVKCGYYRKNAEGLVLNVIRGMVKQIGYTTNFVKKDVYVTLDGKSYRKTCTFYKIQ